MKKKYAFEVLILSTIFKFKNTNWKRICAFINARGDLRQKFYWNHKTICCWENTVNIGEKSCWNFFTLPSASLVIDFENISTLMSGYGICLQVSQKHISYKQPTRNGVLAFLQDYKKMDIVSIKNIFCFWFKDLYERCQCH